MAEEYQGFTTLHGTSALREYIAEQQGIKTSETGRADGDTTPEAANDDLPEIEYTAGESARATTQGEQALKDRGEHVYAQGERLVRPVRPAGQDGASIREVDTVWLRERLDCVAQWRQWDGRKGDWRVIDAPQRVADQLKARVGEWTFPPLSGVVTAPTIRPDGSLLDTAGYDRSTGLIFDPCGQTFERVTAKPTFEDARNAARELESYVDTFPFVGHGDRAACLAALITPLIRANLPTAPAFAFTAPVRGSGKSKLVDVASVIATGARASVSESPNSDEELRKMIDTALLDARPIIALDNLVRPLGSARLCQVTTQARAMVRILGRSEQPQVPVNSTVYATGNNLRVIGDMTRRTVLCRLDPETENPEKRRFDFDPVREAERNRAALVRAALTLLRGYLHAGQPGAQTDYGSFEGWSAWVRSALLWVGHADPLGPAGELEGSDPEREVAEDVIEALRRIFGPNKFSARQAQQMAEEKRRFSGDEETFDALYQVSGESGQIKTKRLGNWLKKHHGRIVNGKRIEFLETKQGISHWRVAEMDTESEVGS